MLLKMKHLLLTLCLFIGLIIVMNPTDSFGQCPMCKGIAESSLKEGSSAAKGLNFGILYLFATPYLLIGLYGWRIYTIHNRKS